MIKYSLEFLLDELKTTSNQLGGHHGKSSRGRMCVEFERTVAAGLAAVIRACGGARRVAAI
jgi:hypothetical protein